MCGIVALYSNCGPVSRSALADALGTLGHRGPDGRGQWVSPAGDAGLAHARLSIIDLETGSQPIGNEDDQIQVVVNGEFYGFERIREDLEQRGHRFRTRSDSEIVLHLYEEYGAHCVHHLRGEFAFLLWDGRRRRMFAVRDRFGIKPLFYAKIGDTFAFASEAKALFAAGLPAQWDRERFVSHAMWQQPDRTLFKDVFQVPPGHWMMLDHGSSNLTRYWDFDHAVDRREGPGEGDEPEHIERFQAALEESVRLRMHADVPVGCYLSGGLDSCSVLGFAARQAVAPIRAFTLSFDDPAYDEKAIAEEMALHAAADFMPISITADQIADELPESVWHTEQPFANAHGVAKFHLSRAVRDAGCRVVLTGEGSDEILAGYPHFRRDMLLYELKGQSPEVVARMLADLDGGNAVSRGLLMPAGESSPLNAIRSILGFVPTWIETAASKGSKMRELLASEFAAQAADCQGGFGFLDCIDVRGQLRGLGPVDQSCYLWAKTMLPNFILSVLGDRMEMAHGVEGRVPFLDHHVVEVARSLPISMKIRGTTEKYVLREAAKPFITDRVYRRQKHPFLAPPAMLANKSRRLQDLLQTTLRGPAFRRIPFYDHARVIRLLDASEAFPPKQRAQLDPLFTLLLSTSLLAEQFGMN